jgi:hypothetical protein
MLIAAAQVSRRKNGGFFFDISFVTHIFKGKAVTTCDLKGKQLWYFV